jgi:hypothetical protein
MRKALDLPYDAWSTIDGQSNTLRVSRATRHKHLWSRRAVRRGGNGRVYG